MMDDESRTNIAKDYEVWNERKNLHEFIFSNLSMQSCSPLGLKNISQIGSFPQVGVNMKYVWIHHLG